MIGITVGLLFLLLALFWSYCRWKYSYWSSKGVRGPTPVPGFGNLIRLFFGERWNYAKDVSVFF